MFPVPSSTVSPNHLLLHAYAWAPRIFPRAAQPFEQEISRQRGVPFSIRELNAAGVLASASERDEYVPVLYSQTQSLLGSPLRL